MSQRTISIENYLCKTDTSLRRTLLLVPKGVRLKRFHCIYVHLFETRFITIKLLPCVLPWLSFICPVNQTRKSNGFSCHLCASVLTRKHDLKRHITSHHGEAEALKLESGNCCCLDCDRKFKKIVELKKHLSTAHSMIFHEEELSFDTVEGMCKLLVTIWFSMRL